MQGRQQKAVASSDVAAEVLPDFGTHKKHTNARHLRKQGLAAARKDKINAAEEDGRAEKAVAAQRFNSANVDRRQLPVDVMPQAQHGGSVEWHGTEHQLRLDAKRLFRKSPTEGVPVDLIRAIQKLRADRRAHNNFDFTASLFD